MGTHIDDFSPQECQNYFCHDGRAMNPLARGIGKSVHSVDQAAFCALMVTARQAAGLTQQAFALRLKKPQSFVAKYEGRERRLDVVEYVAIVRAIGADPLKLLRDFVNGNAPAKPRSGKSAKTR